MDEGPIITISIPEMRKQQQNPVPDNSLEETQRDAKERLCHFSVS